VITPKIHHQISAQGQILFVLADKNYSVFYLENGRKFVSGYTLKYHENTLDSNQYLRINRSMLVKSSFVIHIKEHGKASYVVLRNGEIIPISRRRLKIFQAQYSK
jgi:two-component system LytT family response regulator